MPLILRTISYNSTFNSSDGMGKRITDIQSKKNTFENALITFSKLSCFHSFEKANNFTPPAQTRVSHARCRIVDRREPDTTIPPTTLLKLCNVFMSPQSRKTPQTCRFDRLQKAARVP